MDEKDNVTEQLKELIFVYGFNKNTLSRYLELPVDRVENLAQGDIDFLLKVPSQIAEYPPAVSKSYQDAQRSHWQAGLWE